MKNILTALAVAALLGGCASTSNAPAKAAAQTAKAEMSEDEKLREDEILCTREMRTGSHRKSRVCRTIEQRKQEQQAAREILRNTQTGGGKVVN